MEPPNSLEDLLVELRRRALRLAPAPPPEPTPLPARPSDVARAEELIEKFGWSHLRAPKAR